MKTLITVILLLIIPLGVLAAQDLDETNAPTWMLMELGEKAYREKEFGEALRLFRVAKGRVGIYPEADMWIGLVFEADAEIELAIRQLEMAYSYRDQLYILDDKYTLLYKLADLNRKAGNNLAVENWLNEIVRDDLDFGSVKMEVLVRILLERGLDEVVTLYRFSPDFSLRAHMELGAFLYESGRNPQAINHLLFAIVAVYSRSISFLRAEDPEYAFETTGSFLSLAGEYRELNRYFETSGLFPAIYVLARSLKDTGYDTAADSLLRIVIEFGNDPALIRRARRDSRSIGR